MNQKIINLSKIFLGIIILLSFSVGVSAQNWYIKGGDSGLQNYSSATNQGFYYQYSNNGTNLSFQTNKCSGASTDWAVDASCNIPAFSNREDFSVFNDAGYLWWHPQNSNVGAQIQFQPPTTAEYFFNLSIMKITGGNNVFVVVNTTSGLLIYNRTLVPNEFVTVPQLSANLTPSTKLNFILLTTDSSSGDSSGIVLNISSKASAPSVNFTVTARNVDNVYLNNFSATINGTTYTTTSGTLNTNIIQNPALLLNITVLNAIDNAGGYFNHTFLNVNSSSSYLADNLYQAETRFVFKEALTNNTLGGNLRINNSASIYNLGVNYVYKLLAGNYDVIFINSTYYNKTASFTNTPYFNGTLTYLDVYSSLLNITVRNAFTNLSINNFTGYIYNSTLGLNQSFSTSSGYFESLLIPTSILVYVENPDYAISQTTNFQNVTIASGVQNVAFYLYSNNTVLIYVRDETTSALITEPIQIVLSGSLGDTNYSTSNGTLFLSNILDGNYSVRFSGENYTLREYTITVASRSVQTLTATLSSSSSTVTFTITDSGTSAYIEGATMSQYRLLNSTWTLIESRDSDITGRVQFSYLPSIKYRFIVSADEYNTKQFDLNPILFSSYTIQLDPVSSTPSGQPQTATVDYTPKYFYDAIASNFSIYFRSGEGTLINYGYVLRGDSGIISQDAGLQAGGEGFNFLVNVSGSNFGETLNLTYYFTTVYTENASYYAVLPVYNGTNQGTMIHNIRNDYGLGDFERIFIATLIIIVVAGLLTLIAGSSAGIGFGLLLTGYFAYIQFVPFIASILVILVGVIFLLRRDSA